METLSALPRSAARAVAVKRGVYALALAVACAGALASGREMGIVCGRMQDSLQMEPDGSLHRHLTMELRLATAPQAAPASPASDPNAPSGNTAWAPGPKGHFHPTPLFLPTSARAKDQEVGTQFSTPAGERLGFGQDEAGEAPRRPEWEKLRRQLAAALPGSAEITRANDLGIVIRCAGRQDILGNFTSPGLVQDAAIAARVRAGLASDPRTRDLPRNATCEAGCVRLNGPFLNVAALALAVNAAISVDGVREVRADLPDDMFVLLGSTR